MANTFKLKRTPVAGRVPTLENLELGELAVNTHDGKVFLKKSADGIETVIEVGYRDSVTTITSSLILDTEWESTGINGQDLETGTYAVQIYANDISNGGSNSNEYYSGMMSWYAGDTNGTESDEIVLHRAGSSADGNIYLRTQRTPLSDSRDLLLEIRSNIPTLSPNNYVFKFRKLI